MFFQFKTAEEVLNIRRGDYAAKFSPRSTKFPPSLLGGKKFFAELLLTDFVRQGLANTIISETWDFMCVTYGTV